MKKIIITLLGFFLLITACQKSPEEPKLDPTPSPPEVKDPYQSLIGEWRLISLHYGKEEQELSNCRRQSSITFKEGKQATDIRYTKGENDCTFKNEAQTVTLNGNQLTLKGEDTDIFTYTLKDNLLMLDYIFKNQDGSTVTITTTYKKDYEYNPAKELIGTWYIHHLKRDGYNADDILEGGNCMTQEKVVFTNTQIERYQYILGSKDCKEEVYRGTYSLSKDLSAINVTSAVNGKQGYIDFELHNGVLHLTGTTRLGGNIEWFYQKSQKYKE